ncbi:MAG: NusG domain II-containing protein [Candidatus Fermentibacteraceae bacterium]
MKLLRPGDILPLALALGAALLTGGGRGEVDRTHVRLVTPQQSVIIPMNADTLIEIPVRDGITVVEVGDGRARIRSSPCPTETCVSTGWISRRGQAAVCMPEGVYIEVRGDGVEPDAVSY